jgi:hypothetical protein
VVLVAPVRGCTSDGAIKQRGDDGFIAGWRVGGVNVIVECVRLVGVVDGAVE